MQPQLQTIANQPQPLVGFAGKGASLTVERRTDGLECRVSTGSYLMVLGATALFGPVVASVLYAKRDEITRKTPSLLLALIGGMVLLSSFLFVRFLLLGTPRFAVDYATGEIRYFPRRSSSPSLVLRTDQVRSLSVEERIYQDTDGICIPNQYLVVTEKDETTHALCVSTNRQQLEEIRNDLENAGFGRASA